MGCVVGFASRKGSFDEEIAMANHADTGDGRCTTADRGVSAVSGEGGISRVEVVLCCIVSDERWEGKRRAKGGRRRAT